MENLLLGLGFTKSKEDSNLYFKVEGERLVMLLLYVNELFLIGKEELIKLAGRGILLGMEVW